MPPSRIRWSNNGAGWRWCRAIARQQSYGEWGFIGLFVLSLLPLPAAELWGDAEPEIRPGIKIHVQGGGRCTANFVFSSGQDLFLGTAGHCGDESNVSVRSAVGPFGRLVYLQPAEGRDDFALIRIKPEYHRFVNPAVCHWGGPTGIAAPSDVGAMPFGGKVPQVVSIRYYGTGPPMREDARARDASLTYLTKHWFEFVGPAYFGDSGGPVLLADGRALGIVSKALPVAPIIVPTLAGGPTLAQQVAEAEQAMGLDLELVTAPMKAKPSLDSACRDGSR